MNIAIISYTHLKKVESHFVKFSEKIANADLVIHAGDFGDYCVLEYLQNRFNFAGVWGNVDDNKIRACLQEKEILTCGPFRIGIFHGHGTGKTTQDRAFYSFENHPVDIIIFGHSHQPAITTRKNILMLNPGSLTQKRRERWYSYIFLTISLSGFQASLHFY